MPDAKRQRKQENENRSITITVMTDFAAEEDDEDSCDGLKPPKRVNLHEAGLRRSKRIKEKNDNKNAVLESKKLMLLLDQDVHSKLYQ
jgi:hypothetical protein